MSETRISVRANPEEKEYWESAAAAQDTNFADFVRDALNLRAGLTVAFMQKIKELSKKYHLSEAALVEYMGLAGIRDMRELAFDEDGPILGRRLMAMVERRQQKLRKLSAEYNKPIGDIVEGLVKFSESGPRIKDETFQRRFKGLLDTAIRNAGRIAYRSNEPEAPAPENTWTESVTDEDHEE